MRMIAVTALGALALLGACAQPEAPLTGQALVERGEYLVHSVVLCGDCHTPRDQTMALIEAQSMHGAPVFPPGPPEVFAPYAPAIAGGPANYTEEQFISFLQTGVRPDGSHPRPPMPPYRLNEEDARAVNAYIRSLPAAPAAEAPATP
jgi:mono/diheme cytochrome c family protein